LLHFSGSNDSTVFIDNSPSPKTVTAIGNAKISTAQSKFGSSSLYLDGTGDYLSTPTNNEFSFGTGDFTIECWIYLTSATGDYRTIFGISYSGGGVGMRFGNSAAYNSLLQFHTIGQTAAQVYSVNKSQSQLLNSWNHIAFTRTGTTCRAFVNGIQENVGSGLNVSSFPNASFTDSTNIINNSDVLIGYGGAAGTEFIGYIDEFRITKGVARYTGSFSVPTSEFPATITQLQTKYIGLVGGLNDSNVDYGVEKLSDSSLKIRKMTASGQPLSGSGTLSASVDRVYVNVLNYDNVSISGSISNAISSSYSNIANTATSATSANTATSSSYATTASTATSATSANTANSATSASYSLSSSFAITAGTATSATSATSANSANTATSASYSLSSSFATNAVTATTAGTATSATSATSASYSLSSSYSINSTTATSSSFASTASYNLNSVSSSYSLTASYALNGGSGGTTLTTGSTYPITSSWAINATTASYALNSAGGGGSISYITGSPVIAQYIVVSGSGTTQYTLTQSVSNTAHLLVSVNGVVQNYSSSYTVTGSTINFYQPYSDGDEIDVRFLNGGTTVQTGSIAGQTILYNFSSSQESTLTGLNLTGNKWGVNVIEEWNSGSIVGDTYYNSCSLLMHFSGSNGSTTFTDDSPNNFTVTSVNGAAISTAQSKFGGTSGLFDGTNDLLTIPNNSLFDLSSGDFTIEFWFITNTLTPSTAGSTAGYANILGKHNWNGSAGAGWGVWQFNQTIIFFWPTSALNSISTGNVITATNTWYHISVVRSGTATNNTKIYINGVQQAQGTPSSTNSTSVLTIGGTNATYGWDSPYYTAGYIDELRITKGVARYTTNFTTSSVAFANYASLTQLQTKYIGLVGGLNDTNVDYGIEKLSDTSLKIKKLTDTQQPSGSFLSSSVDRVYVNVLNYDNVSISGSISNAVTASYALTSVTSSFALSASYLIPTTTTGTTKAIFGYGNTGAVVSMTNLVSNTGVVATDTTGVGSARSALAAAGYGTDKAIFGYGYTSAAVSITNLVSNTGVVATDTTGVGTTRIQLAAARYGGDKAIFGYGSDPSSIGLSMTNLVNNVGLVASDTTGVGTGRRLLAAAEYATDRAIFGYGYASGAALSMTNLVGNNGIVASDTTGVGTARYGPAATVYGGDKAIFGYGNTGAVVSTTNLVSNTGVVATNTTGVGTARVDLAAAGYGNDKAIFGYGYNGSAYVSMINLVNNTGVVATDTTGVGTARNSLAAAGYSTS
jgi:hypothetical protein